MGAVAAVAVVERRLALGLGAVLQGVDFPDLFLYIFGGDLLFDLLCAAFLVAATAGFAAAFGFVALATLVLFGLCLKNPISR